MGFLILLFALVVVFCVSYLIWDNHKPEEGTVKRDVFDIVKGMFYIFDLMLFIFACIALFNSFGFVKNHFETKNADYVAALEAERNTLLERRTTCETDEDKLAWNADATAYDNKVASWEAKVNYKQERINSFFTRGLINKAWKNASKAEKLDQPFEVLE